MLVAGQDHDYRVELILPRKLFEDLEPVRARHRNVQEEKIGVHPLANRHHFGRLRRAFDSLVAAPFEDAHEKPRVLVVVVGNDDRDRGSLGFVRHASHFTCAKGGNGPTLKKGK